MKELLPNPAPQILNTDTKLHRYWNLRSIVEAASTTVVAEMMGVQTPRITSIAGPNPLPIIFSSLWLILVANCYAFTV